MVLIIPKIEKNTKHKNTIAALWANAEKNRAMNDAKNPKTEAVIPKINSGVRLVSVNAISFFAIKLYPQLLQKLASILFDVPHFGQFFESSSISFSPQAGQNTESSSISSLHFGQFIITPF